jgi:hypothetical protein
MAISLGLIGVGDFRLGSNTVNKIYLGSDLVWERVNIIVDNNSINGTINTISGITFTTIQGSLPLAGGDFLTGTHFGTTNNISVNVSTTLFEEISVSLYKNLILEQCISRTSDGTMNFSAITINSSDVIDIVMADGACGLT